jgi:hypothetical protein
VGEGLAAVVASISYFDLKNLACRRATESMHRPVAPGSRLICGVLRLGDQGADLDEVVGQNAMSSPDSGPFGAVDARAVPAAACPPALSIPCPDR